MSALLCRLMDHYGSDKGPKTKGTSWHTYTVVYDSLFQHLIHSNINVFELGLGTNNPALPSNMGVNGRPGASLYGWRDYFQGAHIYGADIDRTILFNEDRITTVYCDQTDPQVIRSMWNDLPDMNIIVEDGLHTFEANVTFFENSIHKLRPNGIYVIEDISNEDIQKFILKILEWRSRFAHLDFELVRLPHPNNIYDNNLLIIKSQSVSV